MASRLALLALTVLLGTADAQRNCNQAPTAALRITCQQITNWDSNARTVRLTAKTLIASPGFSGLSVGAVPISGVASSSSPTVAYECMDIPCLCGFFGGTGSTTCTLANGQTLSKALRKEYRMLTDDERQKYNTAMWTIKSNGDYDTLSQIHSQYITSPGAHSGPAFPGWHREFIKRLEIALRRVDPTVALPYWDSTLDSTLPNPSHSCLWGNELMGSQDSTGTVRTGAFRNWLTVDGSRVFTRDIGKTGNLLNEADIQALLSTPDFTQLLAFTAPQAACPNPAGWSVLEYIHGGPHVFTGGDMLITTTATNDPLFFNHHSMIDLIWELWRTQQQSRTERETEYPDDNAACSSSAHFVNNTMAPFFPMVNLDGLSNKYTDNLYQYSPRPTCSSSNVNGCGSKYLFCDVSHGPARCASKINLGGNCSGYTNNEDACYLGQCTNSICTAIPTPSPTTQPPIVTTTPVAPQQETCFNEQQCCSPWASRGECSRNPTYMNVWCKASCGVCTPSTYDLTQACSDFHPNCASWKARGQCTANRVYMWENCRQSCGACNIGMLSARLSSCGFSRESVSVRRPVSAFRSQSAPLASRALLASPVAPPPVPLSAPVLQQRKFAPLAANTKR
ncbi:hypothetical protein Q1695_016225 [Nippostrongylus brasiliensis]|nr:hypothetical protein Q1695_016225 [Nippostrongylus brasiliensis]